MISINLGVPQPSGALLCASRPEFLGVRAGRRLATTLKVAPRYDRKLLSNRPNAIQQTSWLNVNVAVQQRSREVRCLW